ncbi:MiaB/RimO family radical SAM methylthiotransferase [Mucisphaera calidilacus]|uniref:tRNA-2-methylthio-N(6)-dimethylallyladenosine synthase n=1 Tax=Mucisphaera calidilacus TaxID=2527982 RepID=A0A518BX86_9BACT|nr:MiaB/RimO family radical SAM methylthiotransferase [Mucisphaera calidilacus]QDU71591.1 tRNA-2-methylthio-N(6)-dimethylallyladenosine synthase [Mucisphaera calidilacus]
MQQPNPQQPAVFIETFGCQMNVLDTELVAGQLRGLGYRFTDRWQDADVVLYNTCSVREHAEQKVWSRVGILGDYKRDTRPDLVLGVIGCMAERDGTDLVRKHPQVDLMCGPSELDKVPLLIDNVLRTRVNDRGGLRSAQVALQGDNQRRASTLQAARDSLEMIDLARSFSPERDGHSAYVRITRGCNKYCTYCVVPFTRGQEVHRPPQAILDEVRKLVDAGAVEVTLLGQTVNHYHYDNAAAVTVEGVTQPQVGSVIAPNRGTGGPSPVFADDVTSFAQLLRLIHDNVPELQRLRFVTSFPRDFGDDILETIRDCPRICRYLHLPVQSGSDAQLKAMNRGYTIDQYRDLLQRARRIIPDVEIATDIITGFCGETEDDHWKTVDLLRTADFKNSFIFKYSPRPGTVAYDRLEDDVPDDIKKRRNRELLEAQAEASQRVHARYVGKTVSVFVEGASRKEIKKQNQVELGWESDTSTATRQVTQLSGRTGGDLIVLFDGDEALTGTVVNVDIQRATTLSLFGTLAETIA